MTINATFQRMPKALLKLPGGQLYSDSTIELDTDGWPGGYRKGDANWQPNTSLRYSTGKSIDASRVPYIVLPLPTTWPAQFGIHVGDYAAVVYKGHVAFAVCGDFGGNPGEGSLELLRSLGEVRLKNGRVLNAGTDPGAVTIVFPGSGPWPSKMPDEQTLLESIRLHGGQLFAALGGNAAASDQPLTGNSTFTAVAPTTGLATKMVQFAEDELRLYGPCVEDQSPLRERIGEYWRALHEHYDGADHQAFWSAAFISWSVREAGGENAFLCSDQHSQYVHQAIVDRQAGRQGRFWAYRTTELSPAAGDIFAENRSDRRPMEYAEAAQDSDFPSHCDVVVSVDSNSFRTIGGNVGRSPGTVGTKEFVWSAGSLVNAAQPAQQVYAILRAPPI